MRLLIASDHAGVALKKRLFDALSPAHSVTDLGPATTDRVDYPDFAAQLSQKVAKEPGSLGILICGSGIGMSIAANKVPGVRAAVVENPVAARLAREHNDANVLCLGARFLGAEYAEEIVSAFVGARFEGGRHAERVKKITLLEKA